MSKDPVATNDPSRRQRSDRLLVLLIVSTMLVAGSNIVMYHRMFTITEPDTPRPPQPISLASLYNATHKKPLISTSERAVVEQIQIHSSYYSSSSSSNSSKLAGLHCATHGGPSDDFATEEMVYWSDIPADAEYKSPFYDADKYLTFEPDQGGWNNIRMAMETVLVLAHAMGRTLVLPPEQGIYLLGQQDKDGKHKTSFTFNDFFHLDQIAAEHKGLHIISMEEFLNRMGITGKLSTSTGQALLPPDDGRVDWNNHGLGRLWEYLRTVGVTPKGWEPGSCIAAIPQSPSVEDAETLQTLMDEILAEKHGPVPDPDKDVDFVDSPTAVDAPTVLRLKEMMAQRKKLCIYDGTLQSAPLIHFKMDHSDDSRLLTHFYAFVFFQDWQHDVWSKRFIRDHVRYIDEIMCAAARIVYAVRERAKGNTRQKNGTIASGSYDSFHVRRGDFQYKMTRIEASKLFDLSKDQLIEGGTLYIATDERDKNFFTVLMDHYDVTFLDDYMHLLTDVNPNYYGMLDQLVASKGRVFFGTWWSTLSGYVNRMRGYYSVKHKMDGYERGVIQSYYFVPEEKKEQMLKYRAVKQPIYMREFPVAWRDIDKNIET